MLRREGSRNLASSPCEVAEAFVASFLYRNLVITETQCTIVTVYLVPLSALFLFADVVRPPPSHVWEQTPRAAVLGAARFDQQSGEGIPGAPRSIFARFRIRIAQNADTMKEKFDTGVWSQFCSAHGDASSNAGTGAIEALSGSRCNCSSAPFSMPMTKKQLLFDTENAR